MRADGRLRVHSRRDRRSCRPRRAAVVIAWMVVLASLGAACSKDSPIPSTRIPNPGSGSAPAATSLNGLRVKLQKVAAVNSPTSLGSRPGSTDLFVTEQAGRVRRIGVTTTGAGEVRYELAPEPVIDITDLVNAGGERGLLGLAFSRDGATLYIYYTGAEGRVTIDELAMRGAVADPASRRNLLTLDHPRGNHNGGQLVLGPDGFLYLGTGDGGGSGDPDRNGQRTDTLYGRILRIDPTNPSDGKPYGIPPGNPFAGGGGAPEVWSYGLRNPWRFSFDRDSGDLWIADVGQNKFEEIDLAPAAEGAGRGANFGWSQMEGNHAFEGGKPPANHTPPILEYGRDHGECTVIGGFVYRGKALPGLYGTYLYGDLCVAEVRGLLVRDGRIADDRAVGASVTPATLSSFGEDSAGEVYVLSLKDGISKIVPA